MIKLTKTYFKYKAFLQVIILAVVVLRSFDLIIYLFEF